MSRKFLTPPQLPSGASLPSSGAAGDLFFKSDEAKIYVHDGTNWVIAQGSGGSGSGVVVSATAPADPTEGTYWFDSTTTKSYIYYDSFWVEVGYSGGGYIISETAPSNPSEGDVWFSTSEGVIYVFYDNFWVDPSTGGAAGVPAGGAAGAVLTKSTTADYDTAWSSALANIDSIDFDTLANVTPAVGQLSWSVDHETLEFGLDENVTLQIGQEHVIRVKNASGSVAIPDMTVVQFAGATGDTVVVEPAVGDGSVSHTYMVGITTEEIPADGFGFVTQFGFINGVKTNYTGWQVGSILYLDPATPGGLTTTRPAAPNLNLPIAAVTRVNANSGRVLVRMFLGERLNDLHNVQITDLADGETLVYNSSTGRWENGATASDVASLTDTTFTSLSDGEVLQYDAANSVWVNGPRPITSIIDGGDPTSSYAGDAIDGGSVSSF